MGRALGDTGTHPNVIVHRMIKHNYSKASMVQGSMIGIGNQSLPIKRKIEIGLLPWYEQDLNKMIKVRFWILAKANEWNPTLPERDISCAEIQDIMPSELADPFFWKAKGVQLLLGVGTWASILEEKVSKLSSKLVGQKSKFGHIVFGQTGEGEGSIIKMEQHVHSVEENPNEELSKAIKRFWEFEDLSLCTNKDVEQESVE